MLGIVTSPMELGTPSTESNQQPDEFCNSMVVVAYCHFTFNQTKCRLVPAPLWIPNLKYPKIYRE